ncbi:iron-sulfur cluster biosynthesis family protein [Companilactobacillus versmoldensis]|uniref:Core domain-containing protein n=1 Tax=Companilactobacillus versmoldensis DSM 14857 = KCTC 3814 TaxID=1423815 RepID=A0A0R1SH47_9LACO|nr:iron-sulfur cluster biosynthesis family protein [Companilactobacillus versmoldensis]KRL68464.1 hypothetical protein FC27_GL000162 [Companilactobacillus versmoldensis DSM 14857 = KCTC 3814]
MKINIKENAKEYLAKQIPAQSQVILTTDDGSNNYSGIGATCELADKFQLVILKQPDPEFNEKLENNVNYQINILPFEEYLYGKGLNLDFTHGRLILADNGGIIDSNVAVVDNRDGKPLNKQHISTIGNVSC